MASTTCAVCLEVTQSMKILHCGHKFCIICLEVIWRKSREARNIECPTCRQHTIFSQDEHDALKVLPTVYFRTILCNSCSEPKQLSDFWFCSNCILLLCSYCLCSDSEQHKGHNTTSWTKGEPAIFCNSILEFTVNTARKAVRQRQQFFKELLNKAYDTLVCDLDKHADLLVEIQERFQVAYGLTSSCPKSTCSDPLMLKADRFVRLLKTLHEVALLDSLNTLPDITDCFLKQQYIVNIGLTPEEIGNLLCTFAVAVEGKPSEEVYDSHSKDPIILQDEIRMPWPKTKYPVLHAAYLGNTIAVLTSTTVHFFNTIAKKFIVYHVEGNVIPIDIQASQDHKMFLLLAMNGESSHIRTFSSDGSLITIYDDFEEAHGDLNGLSDRQMTICGKKIYVSTVTDTDTDNTEDDSVPAVSLYEIQLLEGTSVLERKSYYRNDATWSKICGVGFPGKESLLFLDESTKKICQRPLSRGIIAPLADSGEEFWELELCVDAKYRFWLYDGLSRVLKCQDINLKTGRYKPGFSRSAIMHLTLQELICGNGTAYAVICFNGECIRLVPLETLI